MKKWVLGLGLLGLVIGIGCTGVGKPGRGGKRGDRDATEAPADGRGPARRGKPQPDGTMLVEIESSGLVRSAFVRIPENYDAAKSYPVVIVNHGGSDRGPNATIGSVMVQYWEPLFDQDIFFVFPNGRHDGGDGRAWKGPGDPDELRDVRFMTDLIDELASRYSVDRSRAYLSGFSNGSGFTWWTMCNAADRFAGFGNVSQQMAKAVMASCAPPAKRPIAYVTGTADPNWSGGEKAHEPPRATVEWVKERWGCKPDPEVETLPDKGDRTTVKHERFACKEAAFEYWEIENGGHAWPSSRTDLENEPRVERSRDLDAASALVAFWRAHAGL